MQRPSCPALRVLPKRRRSATRRARRACCTAIVSLTAVLLPAQAADTVDTVGTTEAHVTLPTGSASNLFEVTESVELVEYAAHLAVDEPVTVTFFAYRHHSAKGTATLLWVRDVPVVPTGGPVFVSTGPISLPLLAGNHYAIGASWSGPVTVYFDPDGSPVDLHFAVWQGGVAFGSPPSATLAIGGATAPVQFYQRLTSVPFTDVTPLDAGCAGGASPRLVASEPLTLGSDPAFELVDAPPGATVYFLVQPGPGLQVPQPLEGCALWLDPARPCAVVAVNASPQGIAGLPLPIPDDRPLAGAQLVVQCLAVAEAVGVANALRCVIR